MTATGLLGLSHYLKLLAERTREEFLAEHTQPFFLIEAFNAPDDTGFQTIMGVKGQANEQFVATVAKREGANAFSHMITIGRASNNDIVIRYRGVSKFHAYVAVGDPPHSLTDAGSTNGTFINDEQLESRGSGPLESGHRVRLSDLNLVYYTPEDFYDFLEVRFD